MHGLELGGRAIVPLRAVTFASGGAISPLAIAHAVGDESRFIDERHHCTRLIPNWLDRGVTPHPMLPAEFAITLQAVVKLVEANASTRDQIQALPAGVYVYRDELDVLVKEINDQRCEPPPYGPGRAPIELSAWPRISESDERLMLEGFEALGTVGTGVSPSLRDHASHGYDPELQRRANAVAHEERERRGRWPTKSEVAKVLANETGKSEENVVRRIRKEWPPGSRRAQQRRISAKRPRRV